MISVKVVVGKSRNNWENIIKGLFLVYTKDNLVTYS